ncbi:hypothetical protein EMCRGX_G010206 [Ephydatia muelleri]
MVFGYHKRSILLRYVTQWLCYLHFAFLQRFDSNWSKTKTTTAPTSPSLEVTRSEWKPLSQALWCLNFVFGVVPLILPQPIINIITAVALSQVIATGSNITLTCDIHQWTVMSQ